MKNKRKKFISLCLAGAAFFGMSLLIGCSSSEKRRAEQQIVTPDKQKRFSEQLKKNLVEKYSLISSSTKEKVLAKTISNLANSTVGYSELNSVTVFIVGTDQQFIVPGLGNEIFISRGLLGSLKYENELAFVLATQLALLHEKVPAAALANLQGQEFGETLISLPTATPPLRRHDYLERDWFEPGGFYDFGLSAYMKAEREAVILCHNAKYDPRGAVTFTQRVEFDELGKILPEQEDRLNQARDEVAKLSPLRDPIVKSSGFDTLLKGFQTKKAKKK